MSCLVINPVYQVLQLTYHQPSFIAVTAMENLSCKFRKTICKYIGQATAPSAFLIFIKNSSLADPGPKPRHKVLNVA